VRNVSTSDSGTVIGPAISLSHTNCDFPGGVAVVISSSKTGLRSHIDSGILHDVLHRCQHPAVGWIGEFQVRLGGQALVQIRSHAYSMRKMGISIDEDLYVYAEFAFTH